MSMRTFAIALLVCSGLWVIAPAWSDPNPDADLSVPVPEEVYFTLKAFHAATGGANWLRRDGWDGPQSTVCSWYGVSCSFSDDRSGLESLRLRLPDNGLDGPLPDDMARLSPYLRVLDLSGNQLQGEVPRAWTRLNLVPAGKTGAGGLNLCWNDLSVKDASVARWMADHHFGDGDATDCLGLNRWVLDREISGSWYSPARPGKGISIQWLQDDRALVYWFTSGADGQQRWLFDVGRPGALALPWPSLLMSRGLDDNGGYSMVPGGSLVFHRTGDGTAQLQRQYHPPIRETGWDVIVPGDTSAAFSDRIDYEQLNRLAGTRCDNQSPYQWMSGTWSVEARLGDALVVEVFGANRALIYWFTHEPRHPEQQVWMMGVGRISQGRIHVGDMIRPVGPPAGPGFDADEVELVASGGLTLDFADPMTALVEWEGLYPDWSPQSFPVNRLTRPRMADCDHRD